MKKIFAFIKYLLWDFSGLRFVLEKIRPPAKRPPNERPPATFMIWVFGVFGVYIALFTIASQRYENNLDRLENRTNAILVLVSKDETRKNAFGLIPKAQNTKIPIEPDFLDPVSSITSLFLKKSEINK